MDGYLQYYNPRALDGAVPVANGCDRVWILLGLEYHGGSLVDGSTGFQEGCRLAPAEGTRGGVRSRLSREEWSPLGWVCEL